MKFSNFLLFASAATASFYLVKNREKIMSEVTETTDLIHHIQDNLNRIQKNMDIIKEQERNIATISEELSYKFNLLENEATTRIQQIKDIWEPYLAALEDSSKTE